jgi:hypothetical protein
LTAGPEGFTAVGVTGAPGDEQLVSWTSADGAVWTPALVGDAGGTPDITAVSASGSSITGIGQVGTPQAEQTVVWSSR